MSLLAVPVLVRGVAFIRVGSVNFHTDNTENITSALPMKHHSLPGKLWGMKDRFCQYEFQKARMHLWYCEHSEQENIIFEQKQRLTHYSTFQ